MAPYPLVPAIRARVGSSQASSDASHQKFYTCTDFGSDLWKNGAFPAKVCSLEVGVNLQDLHFTFSELVEPVGALEDTYASDF